MQIKKRHEFKRSCENSIAVLPFSPSSSSPVGGGVGVSLALAAEDPADDEAAATDFISSPKSAPETNANYLQSMLIIAISLYSPVFAPAKRAVTAADSASSSASSTGFGSGMITGKLDNVDTVGLQVLSFSNSCSFAFIRKFRAWRSCGGESVALRLR